MWAAHHLPRASREAAQPSQESGLSFLPFAGLAEFTGELSGLVATHLAIGKDALCRRFLSRGRRKPRATARKGGFRRGRLLPVVIWKSCWFVKWDTQTQRLLSQEPDPWIPFATIVVVARDPLDLCAMLLKSAANVALVGFVKGGAVL
jgi:hypothetical protein